MTTLHSLSVLTLPSYFQLCIPCYAPWTSAPSPGRVPPNLEKATKIASKPKVMYWKLYVLYAHSFDVWHIKYLPSTSMKIDFTQITQDLK